MTELSFKVNEFEGPLDLILHLIAKHKLNIYDISIVDLLEQYLAFMDKMATRDMELTGEFLEMAARLIYIKTVSLLPSDNEAEEMKKELEGRLIEYSLCKKAAELLKNRFIGDKVFVREPIKLEIDLTYRLVHDPMELLACSDAMSMKEKEKEPVREEAFKKIVSKRIVSVTSKIIYVIRKLYTDGKASMRGLFSGMTDRSERVATFLAILELTKSGRVLLNDDNTELTLLRERKSRENGGSYAD